MKKIRFFLLIVIFCALSILLSSCETVAVYQKPGFGPPKHAPAYGVRNKQPKTLVFVEAD